ncbi:hypothetical protein [Methylomonas rapida]|uniref:Polymerase nucleotidyl transferase domain-containing protein n=1 Tax=Methylomonas rapida TaxID=2963939 RepID=A0ABY7GQK0_9GAMM|nr:hypothetical protein [Methylomonas rapida]WAR46775.1 hypothetical protein NM686_009750 [Methylomonas rapida]
MTYRAKDFIETERNLLFAIVADGTEFNKVLCYLRYARVDGQWRKLATDSANGLLQAQHPEFLHYSEVLGAHLHAVAEEKIVRHFQPKTVLRRLLAEESTDPVIRDLQGLCAMLRANRLDLEHFGVTGSILVGMQNHASDIDLVCYERDAFHRARHIVQALIAQDHCQTLNEDDWLSAYQRRACDFALDEYIWHEQRKYNKAIFNQRKFDLSLLAATPAQSPRRYRKLGFVQVEADVLDDALGFDYPAEFTLKHPQIDSVVCFTATYTGQARAGERIAVAGQLEVDDSGRQRIVVGSNREAIGEYIRVLR